MKFIEIQGQLLNLDHVVRIQKEEKTILVFFNEGNYPYEYESQSECDNLFRRLKERLPEEN